MIRLHFLWIYGIATEFLFDENATGWMSHVCGLLRRADGRAGHGW